MSKTFIIAEIGINHNGDMKLVKEMINQSFMAGANAVKFQKRTIEKVYTAEQLSQPRESPFGKTFYDQKKALELTRDNYLEIDSYCKK
jgi:N-acetylneuraminate synthase